jgi:hypothetical protein
MIFFNICYVIRSTQSFFLKFHKSFFFSKKRYTRSFFRFRPYLDCGFSFIPSFSVFCEIELFLVEFRY